MGKLPNGGVFVKMDGVWTALENRPHGPHRMGRIWNRKTILAGIQDLFTRERDHCGEAIVRELPEAQAGQERFTCLPQSPAPPAKPPR